MIIYVEGHGLINPPPSLLIPLHPFASFSFSGAGSHLELFKSEMTSLAPITIQKNPSLPLSLPPALSCSLRLLAPSFFFPLPLHLCPLHLYLFISSGLQGVHQSNPVVMCQDLIHQSCTHSCKDAHTQKNLLSLFCMSSNGWMNYKVLLNRRLHLSSSSAHKEIAQGSSFWYNLY